MIKGKIKRNANSISGGNQTKISNFLIKSSSKPCKNSLLKSTFRNKLSSKCHSSLITSSVPAPDVISIDDLSDKEDYTSSAKNSVNPVEFVNSKINVTSPVKVPLKSKLYPQSITSSSISELMCVENCVSGIKDAGYSDKERFIDSKENIHTKVKDTPVLCGDVSNLSPFVNNKHVPKDKSENKLTISNYIEQTPYSLDLLSDKSGNVESKVTPTKLVPLEKFELSKRIEEIPETPESVIKKCAFRKSWLISNKRTGKNLALSLIKNSKDPAIEICNFTKLKNPSSFSVDSNDSTYITSKRPAMNEGFLACKKQRNTQQTFLSTNFERNVKLQKTILAKQSISAYPLTKNRISSKYFDDMSSATLQYEGNSSVTQDNDSLGFSKQSLGDLEVPQPDFMNVVSSQSSESSCHMETLSKHNSSLNTFCNQLTASVTDIQFLDDVAKQQSNCVKDNESFNASNRISANDSPRKEDDKNKFIKSDPSISESRVDDFDIEEDIETWLNLDESFSPVKKGINETQSSLQDQKIAYGQVKQWNVVHVVMNPGKDLFLSLNANGISTTCSLQGFWKDTFVEAGDIVHVIAPFYNHHATIDDSSGYLVVNPDFLISSTSVVSSLFCMRKTVLTEIFPGWDKGNFSMILGNVLHQLFQESAQKKITSENKMKLILQSLLKRTDHLLAMYNLDVTDNEMIKEAINYLPSIKSWISQYMGSGQEMLTSFNKEDEILQVTAVRDIEENIWCPKFGIKGKIDLTVDVTIHSNRTSSKKVLPLELKTGRPSFSAEHQGQVSLYSLMLGEHSESTNEGLLLYLKDKPQMKQVAATHCVLRGLIQLRNELAHYIKKATSAEKNANSSIMNITSNRSNSLPEPINSTRICSKCPYILPCTIYQKTVENYIPDSPNHAMLSLVPNETRHLLPSHLNYFKHWCHLLLHEASAATVEKGFWNENSGSREKKGLCFSKMVLDSVSPVLQETAAISYCHVFKRAPALPNLSSLCNVGLTSSDYVVISKEESQDIVLTTGFIISISDAFVEILLDRDLCKKPDWKDVTYRIDKNSMKKSAMASNFTNLVRLMSQAAVAMKLRSLLIDLDPPVFLKTLGKEVVIKGRDILKPLNKPQQRAILKVLMSENYMLLKGLPGTGKTSTIVALVRLLVELKQSVLLTSYTHSAVDNILLKLKQYGVDFLRVGQLSRVHPQLKDFSLEAQAKNFTSVKDLKAFIQSKLVVAATCLGTNHAVLQHRHFDYSIIDEACQILQTTCIGPLFHAKKFVLVGDPRQLPPLVQNETARESGMLESLFCRLETHENTMELNLQYRMNREIMNLCNKVSYDGALRCGTEEVAGCTLVLPSVNQVIQNLPRDSWLRVALSQNLSQSVVFFDTDEVSAVKDGTPGKNINSTEVELVVNLVYCMIKSGMEENNIGVISPYRKQVHLLKEALKKLNLSKIEANTVDQYQGRDKQAIVISCVRNSTGEPKVGDILCDEKRLTVAISRPKHKLIFIGSTSSLAVYKPFHNLLTGLNTEQIYKLPPNVYLYET